MVDSGQKINNITSDLKRQSSLINKGSDQEEVDLGDFDITAVLGEGSFGRVYFAELDKNGTK